MRLSNTPSTDTIYDNIRTISFTGTRNGMTNKQKESLLTLLQSIEGDTFVHGGCVGADEQAHQMASDLGCKTHVWPSNLDGLVAELECSVREDPMDPLERNKEIVEMGDVLLACPNSRRAVLRSGTWSTIRYAKKVGVPVLIVFPDGDVLSDI